MPSGYPTSCVSAMPREYELPDPICFDYDPMVVEQRGPWRYPFHPPYPLVVKRGLERRGRNSIERGNDSQTVVPGWFFWDLFYKFESLWE